jgi:hypothetical protein
MKFASADARWLRARTHFGFTHPLATRTKSIKDDLRAFIKGSHLPSQDEVEVDS